MKIHQFLAHHGIAGDPFGEEDAQTDAVFKRRCLHSIYHPCWSKFFGDPSEPSTAVVFGEKGSGKTALRIQAEAALEEHNAAHPGRRAFVVRYDDFNPPLDRLKAAVAARDPVEALRVVGLADHMDAILAEGVTRLVDRLRAEPAALDTLTPDARRDVLLLAALYDQSTAEPPERRWTALRRRGRFRPAWLRRDLQIGTGVTALVVLGVLLAPGLRTAAALPWLLVALLAGWAPWAWRQASAALRARDVRRSQRVLDPAVGSLRRALAWFDEADLAGQPLPSARRAAGEDRYELLRKLQGVLRTLGDPGLIVLIDRVDEPQLIAGDPRRMRALVWPLLDHKFLRHPGLGVKLLLPIELAYYLEKEDKEFYDRARPDKLNLIKPLRWSGPSLYDLATDRLRACAATPEGGPAGDGPRLRQLIDESVSDDSLKDALGHLRTPRQLFKFLHRLLQEHCHRHTEDAPRWTIDADTFRTVYGQHLRELDAFDRGFGHG